MTDNDGLACHFEERDMVKVHKRSMVQVHKKKKTLTDLGGKKIYDDSPRPTHHGQLVAANSLWENSP